MNPESAERTALITGAGRGIGRAIALALAREGFSLCLAARTRAELEETRRLAGLEPRRSIIVLADLADPEAPAAIVETALQHFGRLDLLVNNAGWAPPRTPILKTAGATIDRIIAVNLRAPIELTRLAAAAMARAGAGTIINVASAAARRTPAGEAAYAAAKAGLVAFTHAAFADLRASGIRMSVIIPGLTDTALIPHNKRLDRALMLAPEDVAGAIVQIVATPARACPIEVILEPQRNPELR